MGFLPIELYERFLYTLTDSYPHHYHERPDLKHNRRPAPGIGFTEPNLPTLISRVAKMIPSSGDSVPE